MATLGFWQLRRLDDRQLENLVMSSRLAETPLPLADLLTGAGTDVETLANRRATASGEYRPQGEVLIRSQVENGTAGYHVITPFELESGASVLVNRGWVPLDMDQVPVLASPPEGVVDIEGLIALDQGRADAVIGPVLPRVDIGAIEATAAPVYLILLGERSNRLPIPVPPPDFTSEGNHLSYAIQWFSFLAIGLIGYSLLLRRERKSKVVDDVDVGHQPEDGRVDLDLR